jgi:hypothetical protein
MFQHEERDVSDDEDDDASEDESAEENGDDTADNSELIKITDLQPSLKKVEEEMTEVNILLQKNNLSF